MDITNAINEVLEFQGNPPPNESTTRVGGDVVKSFKKPLRGAQRLNVNQEKLKEMNNVPEDSLRTYSKVKRTDHCRERYIKFALVNPTQEGRF